MLRCCGLLLAGVSVLYGASATWLERVGPVITQVEKKTYLALPPQGRATFEENFWAARSITAEEYFRRLNYADSMWGSDKVGSGANTDPGRVYLSIGAPTRLTKLPSSRTFVPLEIWYYDNVPGVISTELRLMFFRPNSMGLPKLYSPLTDTMRALLVPQAGTAHAFGPNESLTEADLRKALRPTGGEDEVITAAVGIASGIKGNGNQEILALVTSPEAMLSRMPKAKVTARLVSPRTQLETFLSPSPFGGMQVDLKLHGSAMKSIALEILQGEAALVQNKVQVGFPAARAIDYTHRLDLLPGAYRILFTVDGSTSAFPLEVPGQPAMSEIVRVDRVSATAASHTPFEFDGVQYDLNPEGHFALIASPEPQQITWMIRIGAQVVWRSNTNAGRISLVELPKDLQPVDYRLEAVGRNDSRSAPFSVRTGNAPEATAISYNANLSPALRYAFVGRQWLLRGKTKEAQAALDASLREGRSTDAEISLARLEALEGHLDEARDRIRAVLALNPNHFEALTIFAFVETQFQDYAVAAQLYRRAIAIQDSPALRSALASLPAGQ